MVTAPPVPTAPPAQATQLVVTTQPGGAVSGAAFATQPVVELLDSAGKRTASTATVTAAITSGSGVLLGIAAVAASDGVARFTDLQIDRAGAHTLRFSVTSPSLSVDAAVIAVAPGAASQLALVTPAAGAASGYWFTTLPVVEIRDAAGNRTTSTASVTLSVSPGVTQLGETAKSSVAGRATFGWVGLRGAGGDYTLTYSATGLASVTQTITLVALQAVVAGKGPHTLILKSDGTLWATGYNAYGQLGDGTTTSRSSPVQVMTGVQAVSAGDVHTMILKTDGTLWATGWNLYGQLADGTTTDRLSPVQVMTGVQAVAAGYAYTLILKIDGSLWAAGRNVLGQLGDGTTTDRLSLVQVMTEGQAVATYGRHTMMLKMDGTLWAAGHNSSGELGDGTTTDRVSPVQVMTRVQAVATGYSHTFMLKTDGTLWATGDNSSGQLADGTTTRRTTPFQWMSGVQAVSAGQSHTMIIKSDGTLWATGGNSSGQLGDGTTTKRLYPVQVPSSPVQVMSGVQAVSAGGAHTMMLKTDGTLWATGSNSSGQLGTGTTTSFITFQQVHLP